MKQKVITIGKDDITIKKACDLMKEDGNFLVAADPNCDDIDDDIYILTQIPNSMCGETKLMKHTGGDGVLHTSSTPKSFYWANLHLYGDKIEKTFDTVKKAIEYISDMDADLEVFMLDYLSELGELF